jgi:fibronectin-binding autotransporter adhesin
VNLNGGTLIGDYTGNLGRSAARRIRWRWATTAAAWRRSTTTTLTVDGLVSGATGTGPLVIGIPASSANGNFAGLLPGTGGTVSPGLAANTANTTPVYAAGTVILNNTGNTYTGGTILDSGILQLTVNNLAVLGTGGITLNGGTFQWNGVSTDISGRTVTLANGGGTLDVNGNTVTLANSIGNGGSGALTVASTAANGVLNLDGANTYTGATTVNSGATIGGTGSLAGALTLSSGANALMTANSPLTVLGAVTLNGNTFSTTSAKDSSGSPYTLLTGGSIAGGSSVNPTPGVGSVAGGYAGVVSISGNSVILTVTSTGTAATWTDGNADQNWSEAGNWIGGVPHLAGDAATFNSAGGSAVTLDANETVAGITFNNTSSDVISGGNTLTLDGSGSGALITVSAGTANAINTSVALNANAAIVANSGTSVTLGGTVANSSTAKTLSISGGGTNILSSANTYGPAAGSVGTTVGGATVQVGNNTALGSGDVSVTSSSTLQSGAAGLNVANNIAVSSAQTATVDNNGNALSLGGVISGSGAVSATGSSSLTLTNANTYSGGTTLAASSQLNINNGGGSSANSAIGTGTLTINGGTIDNTSSGDVTLLPAIAQNWNGDFTMPAARII